MASVLDLTLVLWMAAYFKMIIRNFFRPKKCMFVFTWPSLLKSTNPNLFLCEDLQKIIKDLYFFTEKSDNYILCAI